MNYAAFVHSIIFGWYLDTDDTIADYAATIREIANH